MDIRNWPMDQIMQLPDCCFGRRFLIACTRHSTAPGAAWDISELAFPEMAVIWEFYLRGIGVAEEICTVRLALGDQLPTTLAMFNALDPLFMGLGIQGADPRSINLGPGESFVLRRLRQTVHAMGRRLVFEHAPGAAGVPDAGCGVVVSSIPTEVPDCLISGYLRSQ